MYIYINTYIHIYTHTYIYTPIYLYIYTYQWEYYLRRVARECPSDYHFSKSAATARGMKSSASALTDVCREKKRDGVCVFVKCVC